MCWMQDHLSALDVDDDEVPEADEEEDVMPDSSMNLEVAVMKENSDQALMWASQTPSLQLIPIQHLVCPRGVRVSFWCGHQLV